MEKVLFLNRVFIIITVFVALNSYKNHTATLNYFSLGILAFLITAVTPIYLNLRTLLDEINDA